jgi:hypothetical protein
MVKTENRWEGEGRKAEGKEKKGKNGVQGLTFTKHVFVLIRVGALHKSCHTS